MCNAFVVTRGQAFPIYTTKDLPARFIQPILAGCEDVLTTFCYIDIQ